MKYLSSLIAFTSVARSLPTQSDPSVNAYSNFTVALVRAPPANVPYPPPSTDWNGRTYDLDQTVELGISYIREAVLKGANFVAFPELWFPGYYFGPVDGSSEFLDHYIASGLVVNSPNWDKLLAAAATNHVWLEFGFAHLDGDLTYMAQALIDCNGEVIQLRHKLRPSGGERQIFSDGTIDMLKVHQTPFGRLGLLQCWEHMWPSMTFAVHAQIEDLHIAAFPWAPDLGVDVGVESADVSLASARIYAVTGNTWTFMPAVGTAAVFAPNGSAVALIEASDCPLVTPLLYYSLNTTEFSGTQSYDINGAWSWAALEQINNAYPDYIPHESGTFIPFRVNSIAEMGQKGPLNLPY